MIRIGKYRDIIAETRTTAGIGGRYRLTKGKGDIITGTTGWFNNIITNNGLNNLGAGSVYDYADNCHVGTGTTTETAGDTALETFVAAHDSITSDSTTAQASPPYYGKWVRTYRFNPGFAGSPGAVNISEVGISSQATTGDLFSRARVKDGASPLGETTISVLADEWLDVTYELRLYPDYLLADGNPDDGTGTITITGAGSPEVFSYTIRPAWVTTVAYIDASTMQSTLKKTSTWYAVAYPSTSSLGAVTAGPTGASSLITSGNSAAAYSAASYNRDVTLTVPIGSGNASGGVGAMMISTGFGVYQIKFTPAVPKDATKIWVFNLNTAWTRASL